MTDRFPNNSIWVLAYYAITPLTDPHLEVAKHKQFLSDKDVLARIYISEQGINGQMSASPDAANAYMDWLRSQPPFKEVVFKVQGHHEHVFPRLTIKYRRELVAVDCEVDLSRRGESVSPERWKNMLEGDQEHLLLDVRNGYEWDVGRFEGAERPPCDEFRCFPAYAEQLKEKHDPKKTPVMMYCTGGIRCEVFSSILLEAGFENVYQLDGGIVNYGEKVGNDHWLGKLFVFDDRLTVPLDEEEAPSVGKCHLCSLSAETYYNCANMDCNQLFLCCGSCIPLHQGCCSENCATASRRRPYAHQNAHKPFRRWYHYAKEKDDLAHLADP